MVIILDFNILGIKQQILTPKGYNEQPSALT